MSRLLQSHVAGVALSCGALLSAGCADNESSLFIQGVLAPVPPECGVTAAPGEEMLGAGVLDVGFSSEYSAWLLVGNQLTPRGAKAQLRTETARVNLTGAVITLEDDQGELLDRFSVRGAGFVTVNTSEDAAYGFILTTLIPPGTGGSFAEDLDVGSSNLVIPTVKVFGETLGGREIESADFKFPITVCQGCTVSFPLEALDFSIDPNDPTCRSAGEDSGPNPCFPGQDEIDCRRCAGSHPELCSEADQFIE